MINSPSPAEVMRDAIESGLLDVHTALPGRVESFDAAAQTADIKPMIRRVLRTATGERRAEVLPVIPSVPVQFLRAGDFFFRTPVAAGTFGLLIFSEYSIDQWRGTGEDIDPGDDRRHGLCGAIFLPGVHPAGSPIAESASSDAVELGEDGGYVASIGAGEARFPKSASESLARADRVEAELDLIRQALNSVAGGVGGGADFTGPNPYTSVGSTGSDTVKGE